MHNCFKETAETFLSSTGLKLPVDYTVDVDKRKGIYLQVNTESFPHYVLGCALLVILHLENYKTEKETKGQLTKLT